VKETDSLYTANETLEAENTRLKDLVVAVSNDITDFSDRLDTEHALYEDKMLALQSKKLADRGEGAANNDNGEEKSRVDPTHDLWKVVFPIMTGIEMSVRTFDYEQKQYNPSYKDFLVKNIFEVHHESLADYKIAQFVDYAPTIFHFIRKISGVFPEAYLESLGPDSLSKFITGSAGGFQGSGSTGKSGSFFFTSCDKKYLVKTIKMDEYYQLMHILPKYFNYITKNTGSLISKIFGLHKIVMKSMLGIQEEWVIIVMENIFVSATNLNIMYDLKGSTYKRETG